MVCMWDIQRNILPFLTEWKQLISKDLAVLITLLRRSITFFFFPWHLESHLRAWNIQKEALEDLSWKEKMRRCNFQQLSFKQFSLSYIFLPGKIKYTHTKKIGTAKWLCLTLLHSETLGNNRLNTLHKYLASSEDHLASARVWATTRVTAACHSVKSPQKGGAGSSAGAHLPWKCECARLPEPSHCQPVHYHAAEKHR